MKRTWMLSAVLAAGLGNAELVYAQEMPAAGAAAAEGVFADAAEVPAEAADGDAAVSSPETGAQMERESAVASVETDISSEVPENMLVHPEEGIVHPEALQKDRGREKSEARRENAGKKGKDREHMRKDRPGKREDGDQPEKKADGDRSGKREGGDQPEKKADGDRPGKREGGDQPEKKWGKKDSRKNTEKLAKSKFKSDLNRQDLLRSPQEAFKTHPEFKKLVEEELRLERQSRELVRQAKNEKDLQKKDVLREELRKVVEQHFVVKQERRLYELKLLEERIQELRIQIERRNERKDLIIERRMMDLIGTEEDLQF